MESTACKCFRVACLLAVSISATAADWRLYKVDKGDGFFLDAASLHTTNSEIAQVWVMHTDGAKTHAKPASKDAEARVNILITSGYTPPLAYIYGVAGKGDEASLKVIGSIILVEASADTGDAVLIDRALFEIDCDRQRTRALTIAHADGTQFTFSDADAHWEYGSGPDSPLITVVCNRNKYIQGKQS